MRGCSRRNLVDGVNDAMKRAIRPDRHIGTDHVVIDRANQADNIEALMQLRLLRRDSPFVDQLAEVLGPFRTEFFRTGQRAVTADDDQTVDSLFNQVQGCRVTAFVFTKFGAASGPNNGSALCKDSRGVRPAHFANASFAFNRSRPAVKDCVRLRATCQRGADNRTNRSIHSLGITTGGEDANLYGLRRACDTHLLHESCSISTVIIGEQLL